MAVKIDIKKSARINYGANGYRVERVAVISGVTGNVDAQLYNALNDASMPDVGDVHPVISSIHLQEISVEPMGGGNYRAVMSYYDGPLSSVGSSNATANVSVTTATEEITTDINGNPLETDHGLVGSSLHRYPTFKAEVERPRITFEFDYISLTFPQTEIDTYTGKVNSAIWNGYAIGTVFCTGVSVSQQGGIYKVRFTFAYNPDGWEFKPKVAMATQYLVQGTDLNLDITTGVRPFDVYNSVSFASLGFTL